MKHKTNGIVINYIKHRESSIITRIYTSELGLQHYIVNSVRKTKPRYPLSLFQPMNIVDMVVYHKRHGGLNRISEIRCPEPFSTINYEVRKSSIILFLTEILSLSLREEESNPELFKYISDSIRVFDGMDRGFMNFHLQFLLKLTRYLGFGIENPQNLYVETIESGTQTHFEESDIIQVGKLLKDDFFTKCALDNWERI